ncbi:MAG: hypothetical protein ACK5RL_07905 [Acidimicrobiales bacterium]
MAVRIVSALVAVGLVVGAVVVRRQLDDGGIAADSGGAGAALVCDPLVADACRQLADAAGVGEVRVEEPGVTAARLVDAGSGDAFLWVTDPVWAELVVAERPDLTVDGAAPVSAASPVELVSTGVPAGCAAVDWACLASGGSGTVVGLDGPDTTLGMLARAQLTVAHFGTAQISLDQVRGPAFFDWVQVIEPSIAPAPGGQTALDAHLTRRGAFDVVPAVGADADGLDRPGYERTVPADGGPDVRMAVIAVAGADRSDLGTALAPALTAEGWQPGPGSDGTGFPPADVLVELDRQPLE